MVSKKASVNSLVEKPHKAYNPIKTLKEKLLKRFSKETTILINMELVNGMHKQFLVQEKAGQFKFNKGIYLIDNDSKYYNVNAEMFALDYHERFTLPIKRVIPISSIKKVLSSANVGEVEYSSNPHVLEQFVTSKIAEGIMKGQAIDEMLKKIWVFTMIIGALVLGHLVLFMFKSGIFESVQLW